MMKKLILSTGLLLLTLTVLSQTGISTNKDGSKVSLDVMRSMIKEILKGEECDSQSIALYNTINLYEAVIRGQDSMLSRKNKEIENLHTVIFNMRTESSLNNVKTVVDAEAIKNLNENYNQLTQKYNGALHKIGSMKTVGSIKSGIILALLVKIFIFK